MMSAMYEKKLALQAESYIKLKIAYEELTQARKHTFSRASTKAFAPKISIRA